MSPYGPLRWLRYRIGLALLRPHMELIYDAYKGGSPQRQWLARGVIRVQALRPIDERKVLP